MKKHNFEVGDVLIYSYDGKPYMNSRATVVEVLSDMEFCVKFSHWSDQEPGRKTHLNDVHSYELCPEYSGKKKFQADLEALLNE